MSGWSTVEVMLFTWDRNDRTTFDLLTTHQLMVTKPLVKASLSTACQRLLWSLKAWFGRFCPEICPNEKNSDQRTLPFRALQNLFTMAALRRIHPSDVPLYRHMTNGLAPLPPTAIEAP